MESDVNVAVLSLKKFVVSYLNYFVDGHGYINNDSHSTKLKGRGLTKLFLSQFCLCWANSLGHRRGPIFIWQCTAVLSSLVYGVLVYVSQLIRYARACSVHDPFLSRGKLLTSKLCCWDFNCRKLYGRYNDLVSPHNRSLSQMLYQLTTDYSFYPI